MTVLKAKAFCLFS